MTREQAEQLKALYWEAVIEEIDRYISLSLNELRICSPEKLQILQEKIKTLEQVKGLPDRVIEEKSPEER